MDARTRLEANLSWEPEAYGYTLSIWGSGALLIHSFDVLSPERAMAFIGDALVGFGALAVAAFRGVTTEAAVGSHPRRWASTVHIIARAAPSGSSTCSSS